MQMGPQVRILSEANPEGVFGVFEGLDKAGKSELMKAVVARLNKDETPFVAQREPGGTPLAEEVREVLLKKNRTEIVTPETEIMLAMGYRRQNVVNTILPGMAAGKIVLSDRFTLSTYALNLMPYVSETPQAEPLYQLFIGLMHGATNGLIFEPLTFMVVVPEELRQARMDADPDLDRMEDKYKDDAWRERVIKVYTQYAQAPNTVVIDGTLPLSEQVELVLEHLESQRVIQRETVAKAKAKLAEFEAEVERREKEALDNPEEVPDDQVAEVPSSEPTPVEPPKSLEEKIDALVIQIVLTELYAKNDLFEERMAAGKVTARAMIEKTISLVGEDHFFNPHHIQEFANRFQSMEYYAAMREDTQANLLKTNEQLQAEQNATNAQEQEDMLREASPDEVAEARTQAAE